MRKALTPTQIANQGYFKYNQCIHSPIAHKNNIDNYPGSDFNLNKDPKLSKDSIILNLHKLFKYVKHIYKQINKYIKQRIQDHYKR